MTKDKLKVTKLDAAKRQVNASVRMFFSDNDSLAIHTVACAALGLVDDLAKGQGKPTSLATIMNYVVEDKRKLMIELLRRPQNFLKHADKDPADVLEYNPEVVEHYLLFACNGYEELTKDSTPEIKVFMIWYSLVHPNVLSYAALEKMNKNYLQAWGPPVAPEDKLMFLEMINKATSTK